MRKPKMILFDYGNTIAYEAEFDGVRGTSEVLKYAVRNENNLRAEEVNNFATELYLGPCQRARDLNIEFHNHAFDHLLYDYLQIELTLSPNELEQLFWDYASPAEIMPGLSDVLDYLHQNNIRSGVISNISFSGSTLTNRIKKLLPDNHFEFIIASSEYMIRKPDPMLFKLALNKADLSADDVWFCGDDIVFDVQGAHQAGILPVWYDCPEKSFYKVISENTPAFDHIHIHHWSELINILSF
jgi:putative hydrolase of the HAD superfamily